MKEKIIDIIKKYHLYILISLIIILIIIIGFMYAENVSKKEIEPIIEEKEEIIETKTVRVDIKGYVKNEGVYELEEDKRVIDVINAAGGLLKGADTSVINLSKKITDEMVIIIYSEKEMKEFRENNKIEKYENVESTCVCPDTSNDACIEEKELSTTTKTSQNNSKTTNSEIDQNSNETKDEKISINTATKEELTSLSGIGESKAEAIIKYREENGQFETIEDIKNVSGIGDSAFEKIKDFITT
jgi:competence protein ComEA